MGPGTGRCEFAFPLVTFLLHVIHSQLNISGRIPGWSGLGEERSHSASCWPHAVRLEFPLSLLEVTFLLQTPGLVKEGKTKGKGREGFLFC